MESFEAGRLIAFLIAIGVAQAVAIVLFRFSQQSHTALGQRRVNKASPVADPTSHDTTVILPSILQEMEAARVPTAQRRRVASGLSHLFTKQLNAQVELVTQEITQKYEQRIQEHTQETQSVRQKYQETLAQKNQTEAVMRSVAEGLVVVNQKGEVVFLNPAAERLLGVSPKEKLGRPLAEDLQDEQLLSLVKGSSSEEEREVELSAKDDQTKRVLRSSNAVIEDENGETVGMVSVLTDVTKQRELDRLKSEFLSSVTHELRTPLVAMQHSLSIMLDGITGQLSDSQREFLAIAQRNLDRLNRMINDLLDVAKLEARKMALKIEPSSIATVIHRVCETLQAWAASKNIHLEERVSSTLPEFSFDPSRIEQVLHNLVGNAIKFTPKGGSVVIEARQHENLSSIEVSVSDTGVGIAQEDVSKLFKKFQQLGQRLPGEPRGTGLGLAIAKEIVEFHGGRIWVESQSGKGSRFAFSIPALKTQASREEVQTDGT